MRKYTRRRSRIKGGFLKFLMPGGLFKHVVSPQFRGMGRKSKYSIRNMMPILKKSKKYKGGNIAVSVPTNTTLPTA